MTDRRCRIEGCEGQATGGRSECWPCFLHRRGGASSAPVEAGLQIAGATERYSADGSLLGSTVRLGAPKATLDLRPPAPVNVTVKVGKARRRSDDETVAVFLPDPQIGYRYDDDGVLEAFHDDDAMSAALDLVAGYQPDFVVHLGDLLDLAAFSRFAREPGFRGTTQIALDRAHVYLASAVAVAPEANHVYLEGNHDVRIEREVAKLLPEVANLKAAGARHGALSIPGLLGLDDLGIEYVGGYPAGEFWLSDRLRAVHGDTVNSSGSTAAKLAQDATGPYSTVFGHVHRAEFHTHRVRTSRTDTALVWAASPGTLARVDGAVPSFHSGTVGGAALYRPEDWAQGIGVARWSNDDDTPSWQWIGV